MTDPLQSNSKILGIRRSHNEETLHRKYSSLSRFEGRRVSYSRGHQQPKPTHI